MFNMVRKDRMCVIYVYAYTDVHAHMYTYTHIHHIYSVETQGYSKLHLQ